MADWRAQYLTALKARDELEKADADIYEHCTRLADSNAALKTELRKLKTAGKEDAAPGSPVPAPLISYGFRRQTSPQLPSESEIVAQLRQDFATAQQERAELQSRVDASTRDLEIATTKNRENSDVISRLQTNAARISTKLKDKEEELRGKAKLLINVQDENATLNLELDQAEKEVQRIKKENKELVDRWVARMGQEADRMNEESKYS